METEQGRKTLQTAVRERREQLGLSMERAAELSKQVDPDTHGKRRGISPRQLQTIESGLARNMHGKTKRVLDRTLQWDPGTAHTILTTGVIPPQTGAPVEGHVKVADETALWFTNGKGEATRLDQMETEQMAVA